MTRVPTENLKSSIFQIARKSINLNNCLESKHTAQHIVPTEYGNYKIITHCRMVFQHKEYYKQVISPNNELCPACKKIAKGYAPSTHSPFGDPQNRSTTNDNPYAKKR